MGAELWEHQTHAGGGTVEVLTGQRQHSAAQCLRSLKTNFKRYF